MSKKGSSSGRQKRRNVKLIIIAASAIAILGMGAGVAAISLSSRPSSQPAPNIGPLGSAHEHAAFMIKLNGKAIDFSQQKYQVKSPYIHVELNDGLTLHRHATGVPFSEFLHSINMDIRDGCFFNDDGKSYCETGNNRLRYFVDGIERGSIMDYVLNQGDRILVTYGNETDESLKTDFQQLDAWHLPGQ